MQCKVVARCSLVLLTHTICKWYCSNMWAAPLRCTAGPAAKYVETTIEGSGASAAVTKGYTVSSAHVCLFPKPYSCTISLGNCQVLCYPCLWNVVWMQRLYRYISGNNVDNAKIDMTSPVIIFERSTDGFKSAEKNYTVAFYLPQQFQVWQIWHALVIACALVNTPCTSFHLCSAQWVSTDIPSWQSVQGKAPAPKDNAINIADVPGVKLYVKVHCTKLWHYSGAGTPQWLMLDVKQSWNVNDVIQAMLHDFCMELHVLC